VELLRVRHVPSSLIFLVTRPDEELCHIGFRFPRSITRGRERAGRTRCGCVIEQGSRGTTLRSFRRRALLQTDQSTCTCCTCRNFRERFSSARPRLLGEHSSLSYPLTSPSPPMRLRNRPRPPPRIACPRHWKSIRRGESSKRQKRDANANRVNRTS